MHHVIIPKPIHCRCQLMRSQSVALDPEHHLNRVNQNTMTVVEHQELKAVEVNAEVEDAKEKTIVFETLDSHELQKIVLKI